MVAGRVTQTIDALGGTVETQYDPIGNVIAEIDAAGASDKICLQCSQFP